MSRSGLPAGAPADLPNSSASEPLEIKVVIVGDADTGKTSLSIRYCHGEFESHQPTIGANFLKVRVVVEGTEISLQIWDTAGQERFRSMAPMYYRGAKAAICVFDVTNEESFHRVSSWLRDLKPFADPNCVICLAGNKCDKGEKFDLALCEELAQSMGAIFVKTSALTGEGVTELFDKLSRSIAAPYRHEAKSRISTREADVMRLGAGASNTGKKEGGSCC